VKRIGVKRIRQMMIVPVALTIFAAACARTPESDVPLFPQGELAAAPPRFTFPPVPGAATYRLTIRDAGGKTVASLEGPASPIILSLDTRHYFKKGERYRYEVLPLNKQKNPAGKPRVASFLIRAETMRDPD